jgi:hypothetical protein
MWIHILRRIKIIIEYVMKQLEALE